MAIINGDGGNNALTGTGVADEINGAGGDDLLFGLSGNDTLDGGTGTDIMLGGAGNDIYIVDDTGDIITESTGLDTVRSSVGYILLTGLENLELTGASNIDGTGNSIVNSLTGNTGENHLKGLGGNDVLSGLDGNDTLEGGIGKDTLTGGIGDDLYIVSDATDILAENFGEGTDTVQVTAGSFVMAANIENMTVTGTGIGGTGNALVNVMVGSGAANTFYGMDNDDTLNGGAGADRLYGGMGNDLFIVDNTLDKVTELAGQGADTVRSSVNYTLVGEIEELVLDGVAAINGTGSATDNTITGNIAANTLNGGLGLDTLIGGLGNDTYIVDTPTDTLTENPGEGEDTVRSSVSFVLAANFENIVLTGTAAINATGNTVANTLTGNSAANVLTGGDGDDAYVVGLGDTVVEIPGQGTDTVFSALTYTLGAEVENLTLTGGSAINGTGNAVNNTITGNTGKNTLTGGLGDDTYVAGSTDVIVELAGEGTDTLVANFSATLLPFIENLTLSGTLNLNGTGNAGVNTITGNSGNNTLNGMGGLDTLAGGLGNDVYIVDAGAPFILENPGEGTDTVRSSLTHVLDAEVENLVLTGLANINGTGNAGNNSITGNAGINVLDGGDGDDTFFIDNVLDMVIAGLGNDTIVEGFGNYDISADPDAENIRLTGTGAFNLTGNDNDNTLIGNSAINILDGGAMGDDTYHITKGDIVIDGGGNDTLASNFSNTANATFENITLLGTSAWTATGDAGVNILIGNSGANILNGLAAGDTMAGGGGNDTYIVDDVTDVIIDNPFEGKDTVKSSITFTLGNDTEVLILTGTANIDGTGAGGVNTLVGNAGINTLDGGAGADLMKGGSGNDVYFVDDAGDVVTDTSGFDTVIASASFIMGTGVEVLQLEAGAGDINGTGNLLVNIISGNDGENLLMGLAGNDTLVGGTNGTGDGAPPATLDDLEDTLDGGLGADFMAGGDDSDLYFVDSLQDQILENSGEGLFDAVYTTVSLTMPNNVELMILVGEKAITGTGQGVNEAISGSEFNNTIDGGGGNDVLYGAGGTDYIKGGLDNDLIGGGTGLDTLEGGTGADMYYFESVDAVDVVKGFSTAEGDIINLSDLVTAFDPLTDQITDFVRFATVSGNTVVSVDADGATGAGTFVTVATLQGVTGLTDEQALLTNGNLVVDFQFTFIA